LLALSFRDVRLWHLADICGGLFNVR